MPSRLLQRAEKKNMNQDAKVFEDLVARRRSMRAFLPQPVPQEILESIFSSALHAPSNCNSQPWIVHVASGDKLEILRHKMPAEFMEGKLSMDFPYDGKYPGIYQERQYGSAQALYDSVGIKREDKAARQEVFMRNFSFFDAPHVAFLFLPEPFDLRPAADLGMFTQTLMLSFTAHGLGSCPQTALSLQADLVRETLAIEPGNKLLFGISFGYPDLDAPINSCTTTRAALADIVTFHQ